MVSPEPDGYKVSSYSSDGNGVAVLNRFGGVALSARRGGRLEAHALNVSVHEFQSLIDAIKRGELDIPSASDADTRFPGPRHRGTGSDFVRIERQAEDLILRAADQLPDHVRERYLMEYLEAIYAVAEGGALPAEQIEQAEEILRRTPEIASICLGHDKVFGTDGNLRSI